MALKLNKRDRAGELNRRTVLLQEERNNILTPKSDFFVREAYKTLRTNVSFALAGAGESKLVMVASALQREGKSITAVNLAISYAQTDRKVLLIDCDLRRPKLSDLLQVSSTYGLSNVLIDPALLDYAIMPTGTAGLDVLLAGDIPPNPSELLGSQQMQRLLQEMRKRYDCIILDTPPVNLVIDAAVLAPQCDGVLLVVRAGQSERGAVLHAVEQLDYAKAKILGFALNGTELKSTGHGSKKYRGQRYSV